MRKSSDTVPVTGKIKTGHPNKNYWNGNCFLKKLYPKLFCDYLCNFPRACWLSTSPCAIYKLFVFAPIGWKQWSSDLGLMWRYWATPIPSNITDASYFPSQQAFFRWIFLVKLWMTVHYCTVTSVPKPEPTAGETFWLELVWSSGSWLQLGWKRTNS